MLIVPWFWMIITVAFLGCYALITFATLKAWNAITDWRKKRLQAKLEQAPLVKKKTKTDDESGYTQLSFLAFLLSVPFVLLWWILRMSLRISLAVPKLIRWCYRERRRIQHVKYIKTTRESILRGRNGVVLYLIRLSSFWGPSQLPGKIVFAEIEFAVPEPSTLWLLIVSSTTLAWRARDKSKLKPTA